MKNEYYGDKRDLVKWGTLIHLCQTHNLRTIIQVAFFRGQNSFPEISSSAGRFKLHSAVWNHFRDIKKIKELHVPDIDIIVIDFQFDSTRRSEYTKHVISVIQEMKKPWRLVFLDPDTGIAPNNTRAKHVTEDEIKQYWETISKGECLALYQHAKRTADWQSSCKNQFMQACGISLAETYECPEIAHDVAFFAALK